MPWPTTSRHEPSKGTRIRGRKGVELRRRRLARSSFLCEWCRDRQVTRLADVVDHILPLALGGHDVDENTRNLCDECHLKAGAQQFGHKDPRKQLGLDGWPLEE